MRFQRQFNAPYWTFVALILHLCGCVLQLSESYAAWPGIARSLYEIVAMGIGWRSRSCWRTARRISYLRVSELKWCTRAWRTIIKHGLQGGAWLEQFHKSSEMSVGDRRTEMADDTARLGAAAVEDLRTLQAKLRGVQGNAEVDAKVRDLASYVLCRCEMFAAGPHVRGETNKYELFGGSEFDIMRGKKLASGATGDVFKIEWFHEYFAIKQVHLRPHWISYYDKEVAAMTKIRCHPRLIRFVGVTLDETLDEGRVGSIVMELMDADLNMHLRMRRRMNSAGDGPFPLHVAVDIMLQVAEGVEMLHKHRLFHRDLKSSNILVQPVEMQALHAEGYVRVKLADFGLAEGRSGFDQRNVGTRRWMAPEISGFSDMDDAENSGRMIFPAKADSFSFAMLCFEIITGFLPFLEIGFSELRKHVFEGGARPELPAALPPRLTSLVQRCWDKDPTRRPLFPAICKELRYLKFLITIGGEEQVRSLDRRDEDAEMTAQIVQHLRWIDFHELKFQRHIGSGGYGSVDEYVWRGERVAVKNLLRCSTKKRVEEEAALLVRVEHPNVVKLVGCALDAEERKGMIVMELMDQDLHQLISKNMRGRSASDGPPFSSIAVAVEIMLKVATAMKHIRECNVLHRDLKTSNILVNVRTESASSPPEKQVWGAGRSSDGAYYGVKLADFGLSKYKREDAMFTTKASEAQVWRAPETCEARNYSWPADVFSFGIVCYEILSGEVPFRGMRGDDLLRLVRDGKRPEIPSYCPSAIAELVGACWATDPKDRPEFADICMKLMACIECQRQKSSMLGSWRTASSALSQRILSSIGRIMQRCISKLYVASAAGAVDPMTVSKGSRRAFLCSCFVCRTCVLMA